MVGETRSDDPDLSDFTLSSAIVFTQFKIPLPALIDKGHHYLKNVVQDRNGCKSLALAVMRSAAAPASVLAATPQCRAQARRATGPRTPDKRGARTRGGVGVAVSVPD